ncbi:MAG: hypothetical protein KAY10_04025 [Rhodoferax sp.]|jgi:hypothetical protein|nr:hypothetical protein [Rhodoferax sp.]
MPTEPAQDAVFEAFANEHSIAQFEANRNAALGIAGVCVAIVLTIVQTQVKTDDATAAMMLSGVAIPLSLLSASMYEYFVFLGEKSFGFYRSVKIPFRFLNGAAQALLVVSFCAAVRTISSAAASALLVSGVIALVAFGAFHTALSNWLKNESRST